MSAVCTAKKKQHLLMEIKEPDIFTHYEETLDSFGYR